jgi:hypothetical protein
VCAKSLNARLPKNKAAPVAKIDIQNIAAGATGRV